VIMAADDRLVLRPVRLVVTTNWDAGFQLTPNAEPLPDVPPGGEYVIECVPQQPVLIREALVRDYALVQVSVGSQTVKAPLVERGSLPRTYRLPVAITVHADECVAVRLRNDGAVTLKQKVPTFVRVDAAAARIDPAPTGRAEDAVPCPACGKEAGTSCDGPASHPSRLMLHIERSVAKSQQATVEIVDDRRSNSAVGSSTAAPRDPSSRCPTCDSPVRSERRQLFGAGGTRPYCKEAWHDGPTVHAPQITRTTAEGPGNASLVRGCSCGAEIRTTAAFAEHVGVPEDAMRAILALAGIAFDLIDHPKAMRADARRQITRCLEFAR
jgi:hypothetical protein